MERQLNRGPADASDCPRLYTIFDIAQPAQSVDLAALCRIFEAILDGGAQMIQVRAKKLSGTQLLPIARQLVARARRTGAHIFVNTHARVARQSGADGVHRPAQGVPVSALRRAGARRIGVSTHSLREAIEAEKQGADFIAFSPIFSSASKPGYGPALGLSGLQAVCGAVDIPVYALAGITPENAPDCLAAGAFGVAVMGGIMGADDPAEATRRYLHVLRGDTSACDAHPPR